MSAHKFRLTISRPMGGSDEGEMRIAVTDDTSFVQFLELRVSLTDMMLALTGRGEVPATGELRAAHLVGSKREHKVVEVPFDMYSHSREDKSAIAKALKPFEVDGWQGNESDMVNGHRAVGGKTRTQKVGFSRHVHATTGLPITK